jgi:transposase
VFGYEPLRKGRRERLEDLRTGDGRPLPVHLKAQIIRELDRLELVLAQLKAIAAERDALLKPATDEAISPPTMLTRFKGIGPETTAVLWSEGLFRRFDNRRQVAAYAGLSPTPWQSGSIDHEQGVSKAGNPRLRITMVELAWLWLHNQPTSALSLWFRERVEHLGGKTSCGRDELGSDRRLRSIEHRRDVVDVDALLEDPEIVVRDDGHDGLIGQPDCEPDEVSDQ